VAPPVGERVLETYPTSEYTRRTRSGPVVKTSTYQGLTEGSKVLVNDPYWPKFAGVKFQFLCYCHHVESGVGWIEVFGGLRGGQLVRSFPVHSILKAP
jgi:hypothetical protein